MKLFDEKKAVNSFLEMDKNIKPFTKKTYIQAFIYIVVGLGIILYLVFFSKNTGSLSSHILSFTAGVWIVFSYIRITEVIGVRFVVKYLDYEKLKQQKELLDNQE